MTWVSFFWPTAPSSRHCSNLGMTTISSWMMIELVMYGMIPSPNTANLVERPAGEQVEEAEHAAVLGRVTSDCTALKSMPGQGMLAPNR